MERSKISFIISLLTGRVLRWADSLLQQNGPVLSSLDSFNAHVREVFVKPLGDEAAGEHLYHLKQGKDSIYDYDYTQQFHTVAATSGWNEHSLLTTYRQGLKLGFRLQLATEDDAVGLEAIQVAARRTCYMEGQRAQDSSNCHRPPEKDLPSPEPAAEPMQVDHSRLSQSEKQHRLTQGLCLYCWGICYLHAPFVQHVPW